MPLPGSSVPLCTPPGAPVFLTSPPASTISSPAEYALQYQQQQQQQQQAYQSWQLYQYQQLQLLLQQQQQQYQFQQHQQLRQPPEQQHAQPPIQGQLHPHSMTAPESKNCATQPEQQHSISPFMHYPYAADPYSFLKNGLSYGFSVDITGKPVLVPSVYMPQMMQFQSVQTASLAPAVEPVKRLPHRKVIPHRHSCSSSGKVRPRKHKSAGSPTASPAATAAEALVVGVKKATVANSPQAKQCSSCCTEETPMWRNTDGGVMLCNACGKHATKQARMGLVPLQDRIYKKEKQ